MLEQVKIFALRGRHSRNHLFIGLSFILLAALFYSISYEPEAITTIYKSAKLSFQNNEREAFKDALTNFKIKPLNEVAVNPLEVIPDLDEVVSLKKKSVWNPFNKNKYKYFNELDLTTQCRFYFRELYNINENWSNHFDKFTFNIKNYDDKQLDSFKDKHGVTLADEETIRIHKKRHDIALALQRQRVYDSCFLADPDAVNIQDIFSKKETTEDKLAGQIEDKNEKRDKQTDNLEKFNQWDFEHSMFPFVNYFNKDNFTNIMPNITKGNGEFYKPGSIPHYDPETGKFKRIIDYKYDNKKSFWGNWNKASSLFAKRGIALSFADSHLEMALKLIATLRFQGNKLPIQIIYKDNELSKDTMSKILQVAHSSELKFPGTPIDESIKPVKQDVWFLDVTNTVDPSLIERYTDFKNKWLACIFNLFEEFIFMDIDAVNYVPMEYFFEMDEYKRTGTVFFRDRMLRASVKRECVPIFETLTPNYMESKYFGNFPFINKDYVEEQCDKYLTPEELIYKRYFINHKLHQMESGLFAINKTKHVIPLIFSMMLHMTPQVRDCNYGDKEFYWIGFVVSGHSFAFNEMNAGSVGKYEVLSKKGVEESGRICAIQIAHMNKDGNLLWVNSGGSHCKFPNQAKKDWDEVQNKEFTKAKFSNFNSFKKYYDFEPLDADYGIIGAENYWGWTKPSQLCQGYWWCVKHDIKKKEFSFEETKEEGTIFKFSNEERKKIYAINKIWTRFNSTSLQFNILNE
ncbi:hypothetical protein Kpol_1015p13 [Vanderwaltozyma polyspora DSM 70294]|uniref:Uncharacterized protein n=1 Tax=Vanderwaltozyma polyspora (strain ATCC 22028 / DSM 70294 / BCRC 21397 / CBS 2163 / NBRC 10782 / NRRL Y-8283 / UCD 57-17) TaxID=436907 RepID=A7TQP2_VANPO|nr:uncharacterized protein Kpol_1015p13 [Vanderwaltozyma polyspora DSM 70294]EDO15423.1 hypothetical protein Kpol_1015p13 [Vanderwaltozyma polyspora DSM 70294]